MLFCPSCGGDKVHKILSPVAVQRMSNSESRYRQDEAVGEQSLERQTAYRLLQAVQGFVRENFENVGTRLAEESLKMHYGAVEPRDIRGVVTCEEEKMLQEEGVELLKIPYPVTEEDIQ